MHDAAKMAGLQARRTELLKGSLRRHKASLRAAV